jgi:hypothetical protein
VQPKRQNTVGTLCEIALAGIKTLDNFLTITYKYGMNDITKTIEDRKEKITEELSRQYSLNKISMEEYERLIEYSHKIETEKELMILEKIVS